MGREGLAVGREGLGVGREGLGVGREGLRVGREGLGVGRDGLGVAITVVKEELVKVETLYKVPVRLRLKAAQLRINQLPASQQ